MTVDLLIIGQGLCGTFLSLEAQKAGYSFHVVDALRPSSASRVSAGVLNPITGKRFVRTWMADTLLPYAEKAYRFAGETWGVDCIREIPIVHFFKDEEERDLFENRRALGPAHTTGPWASSFHHPHGYGIIQPAYVTDVPGLLRAARLDLAARNLLEEGVVQDEDLIVQPDHVTWKNVQARYAVFCDGVSTAARIWFTRWPFAVGKGEALVVDVPGLSPDAVYKHESLTLVPRPTGDFWAGASHEWTFDHDLPTDAFRSKTEAHLKKWLRIHFRTLSHVASVRPCTQDRKPMVGVHPHYPTLAILGGMGTKGGGMAPYFARELVARLF